MYPITTNDKLTFENERLLQGRHKVHPYPAMLHPYLVGYLLDQYGKKSSTVLDPFCGTGVTLYESSKRNITSIGFDINPLALLIACVKTNQYDFAILKDEFLKIEKLLHNEKNLSIPEIHNIDFWYKEEAINELGKIRTVLKNNNFIYKDFFLTTFGFTARNQSNTRNGEFKKYKMTKHKVENHNPKVIEKFLEHTNASIQLFMDSYGPKKIPKLFLTNSENNFPKQINYDLVVTSPPYGDSKTTVAYGQYSSFATDWIRDLNPFGEVEYKIDNESLGKKSDLELDIDKFNELNNVIKSINNIDVKRANEVLLFFNGYYKSLKNTVKNLKSGGTLCFVVGNRTVKGFTIPMDQITSSFLNELGLQFKEILVRDIVNKVMPSKNSPTNKSGVKKSTMVNEYIVIFTK